MQQRQPLATFKGTEHLGLFAGHGAGIAVCEPGAFTALLRVPRGVLTGRSGGVLVDLVEPGQLFATHHRQIPGHELVTEETYRDASPRIVIAVVARVDG